MRCPQACEMMLTSQPIKEGAAKKLGLVDDVVPKEKLLPAARQLALAIAAGKAPRSQTLYRTDKLESLGEALAIITFAKAQAAKKGAHLTHPQLCLDAIQWGVEYGGLKGIEKVCGQAMLRAQAPLVMQSDQEHSTQRLAPACLALLLLNLHPGSCKCCSCSQCGPELITSELMPCSVQCSASRCTIKPKTLILQGSGMSWLVDSLLMFLAGARGLLKGSVPGHAQGPGAHLLRPEVHKEGEGCDRRGPEGTQGAQGGCHRGWPHGQRHCHCWPAGRPGGHYQGGQ